VRGYRRADFRRDFAASVTVALLDVPQGMAYAMIAGLPPVYGLYSSIVLALVSALFCQSNQMVSGPTNAVAVVVASALATASPEVRGNPGAAIALLTLMVGVCQFAFGVLKVGNLAQFVSRSVLAGFTCGAGILIALGQIGPMFGVEVGGSSLVERVSGLVWAWGEADAISAALGLGTAAVMWLGGRWRRRFPWALASLAVAGGFVYAYGLDRQGVALVGTVPNTLPPFAPPAFALEPIAELAGAAIAIAILGCVESLSIAKTLAVSTGQRVNSNQDFIGLGLGHIAGGFFQCMPGCGSFTRSALNHASGARTRFSAVFCAVWVALVVVLLGPAAAYLPKASLAGMLVVLGLSLVKWKEVRVSLRSTRSDAAVFVLTFGATLLLHLDTAVYIGVLGSLVLFLRKASAPHLVEYDMEGETMREIREGRGRSNPGVSIIHVEGELFFGAAELFEEEVRRLARDPSIRVVILRMKNARHLDATAVMALEALHRYLEGEGRLLLISGASDEVVRVLERSGLLARLGVENVFRAEENLTMATRKALLRAKEFLGAGERPEVRIFYEKTRAEKPVAPGA
jgi:SulP family sulfate permease